MSEFILTDKHAIAFYHKHSHLDFNVMNTMFVDIMDNLLQNMSDNIENSHNTTLIKQLSERLEKMDNSLHQQNNIVSESISQLSGQFSTLITQHLEVMLSHMRDTIKSNNGDTEKSILQRIQQSNDLLLSDISVLTKNDTVQVFLKEEMTKINTKVQQESERLLSSFEKTSKSESINKINELITSQYTQLDTSFKARIDSFFTSQSTTQGSMYSEILGKLNSTTATVDMVGTYFHKQIGSTNKGKQGEAKVEVLLSDMFPSGNIQNTSGGTACGDFIVERTGKSTVLIDTKDYDTVVPVKEVSKMIRDVEKQNFHGILISQNSGIAQKNDFEINVHDHKIMVFLHNVNYNSEKIKMAFNIIDHLEPYLVNNNMNDNNEEGEEVISNELLALINKEYQELVSQKLNLIQTIRKSQGDLILQVQKMDLPALTSYLDKKFANTGKTGLVCDVCNVFIGKNPKSLAAHKRRCTPPIHNTFIDTSL